MNQSWSNELWRAAIIVAACLLIGALAGNVLFVLVLGLSAYLFWHLRNLYRLSRWLTEGKRFHPPEARGIWGDVFNQIDRLQVRNRKRKKKLRNMLKRFRESTAAMPDGAVVLDPYTAIEWWNPAAQRLLAFSYPTDVGRRIGNLVRHPAFQAYLDKGDFKRAVEIPAPADESVTLSLRMVPYGKHQFLLTVRDVTRLRYLERVREDFVANVSHELRTPLTVISGYLESMAEDADELPPRWHRMVEAMRSQAERMCRIVTDLLALSRLEADHRMDDAEPADMAKIVERVCADARGLSGEQNHRIQCQVDHDLWLLGDEEELQSLVSNLVFNAVRYTPAGGSIEVTWAADGAGAHLSVADTGIGIPQQHIARLTERFYRVDVGRSRDQGGTGLGLAIVKHILARHQGSLVIESEPGRGSLFRCDFPAGRLVAAPPQEATA